MKRKNAKWKCDKCGDITIETIAEITDCNGDKMPSFGWGCWKCGRGRRKFICYSNL